MGFLDKDFVTKAKAAATKAVDQHGPKIASAIDKGAAAVDKQTKGKYSDKIVSGREKAKGALDSLDKNKPGRNEPGPNEGDDLRP